MNKLGVFMKLQQFIPESIYFRNTLVQMYMILYAVISIPSCKHKQFYVELEYICSCEQYIFEIEYNHIHDAG